MLMLEGLKYREKLKKRATEIKDFKSKIEEKYREIVFESAGNSTLGQEWTLPAGNNEKHIGEISFSNTTARKIAKNLEEFFDTVFLYHPNQDKLTKKWSSMIAKYREMMKFVNQRTDFTDNELEDFQAAADKFYLNWIELTGRDGMTNYIHIFGTGHALWYAAKHRNFYRYSNQSWVRSYVRFF